MVHLHDKTFNVFIPQPDILRRIDAMAEQINHDYAGRNPLFLAILNGAFVFAADLIRRIATPCEITFLRVASYEATQSRGEVKRLMALQADLRHRNVIILEDIVDTGITMEHILADVVQQQPRSVEIATLLFKPTALRREIALKYVGFEIPNQFVVGYGLDYDGLGRNLPDLYVLTPPHGSEKS